MRSTISCLHLGWKCMCVPGCLKQCQCWSGSILQAHQQSHGDSWWLFPTGAPLALLDSLSLTLHAIHKERLLFSTSSCSWGGWGSQFMYSHLLLYGFFSWENIVFFFCSFLRLWGEPVNLREQHDALEFFNSLVDSLDEALKALGHPAMLSKVLGGSFADQKICQGCPHR